MAIGPVDLAGAATQAATPAAGDGAAFDKALGAAQGGGVDAQLEQTIGQGAVQVMGGMMMRLAGEALNAGLEDDEG